MIALAQLLDQAEAETKKALWLQSINYRITSLDHCLRSLPDALGTYRETKDPYALKDFETGVADVRTHFLELKLHLKEYPDQMRLVEQYEQTYNRAMVALSRVKTMLIDGNTQEVERVTPSLFKLGNLANEQSRQLQAQWKDKSFSDTNRDQEKREQVRQLLIAGVTLNVLIASALALLFSRLITGRLKVVKENSLRIATGQQLNSALSGSDEIASLDRFLHGVATMLEQSRRKERAIVEKAVDVICSIDDKGKFVAVNPSSLPTWGFAPEELVGKRYGSIILAEDLSSTQDQIQQIIALSSKGALENRVVCKDGSAKDMRWSVQWSDEEQSLFCVMHDISAQKRADEERRAIESLKQEFVAMVSHDLRTPLTSIQATFANLLYGNYGTLTEKGNASVARAEKSTDRLIKLINDLLDLEKLEAGQMKVELTAVYLQEVIECAAEEVKVLGEKANLKIEAKHTDAVVVGDKDRLTQVLVNLLSNAIKFSESGSQVRVETQAIEDDCFEVRVIDSGIGIPEHALEKVFARFQQVNASDGARNRGTGLGLPICKAIIEAHDGTIGVRSEIGKGSTFWFRLKNYDSSGELSGDEPS